MKKNLVVIQGGIKECGASCLLSIVRYYGGNISINKMVDITNTEKTGTNFYNLKMAAKTLGLDSKSYKIDDINILESLNLPLICQLLNNNYEHFVVVYKISGKKISIMDPAVGIRKLTILEFSELWTGYAMVFSPYKKLPVYKDERYLDKIIMDTLKNNKSIVQNILILSIIFVVMSCFYTFYGQIVIDNLINTTTSNLLVVTFMFAIVILIKCLANFIRNLFLIYLNQKIDCSLFLNTFSKILLLPYNYYRNKTTGEIISRINDLAIVKSLLSKIILTVFLDIIISLSCGLILFKINKSMFILVVIIILEYIIIYYFTQSIDKKYINILQENNAQINSKMIENINGFETIKNLNAEGIMMEQVEKLYVSSLDDVYMYDNFKSIEFFLKDIIGFIGTLLVSYYGYKLVMLNVLSIGNVVTFLSLMSYFVDPIKNLLDLKKEAFFAINAIKRVNDLFDIDCEDLEHKTKLKIEGKITISNLIFSYDNCNKVLDNINIDIDSGNKVLILGKSGSGKSTILKIIYRYYSTRRGMIYLDNVDINDYALADIRSKIVYISQDETLFTDSIKNNIILNRTIDYQDFIEVCNLTYVNEIVDNLFLGYDTKLEENGINISDGQKQRIVLARALLKDSKIILIDEGLNAINIDMERKILENIFNKYKDKTIIVVSHRIENINLYDKVLKFNNGELINENICLIGDVND